MAGAGAVAGAGADAGAVAGAEAGAGSEMSAGMSSSFSDALVETGASDAGVGAAPSASLALATCSAIFLNWSGLRLPNMPSISCSCLFFSSAVIAGCT